MTTAPSGGSRPNVLWITTDQQRADSLGCYGATRVETPHIDALAADGVRFDRCYAQSTVCAPSRGSMLTGRYPSATGLRQNGGSIDDRELLFPRMLSGAGYTCALAGKLHLAPCHPDDPDRPTSERRIDDGYDEFHWSHDPAAKWPTNEYRHWLRREGVDPTRTPVRGSPYVSTTVPAEYHQTTWCVDRAIDVVEANADAARPWHVAVNVFDPHHPFAAPAAYLDGHLRALDEIALPAYEPGELEEKPAYQRIDHEGAYGGLYAESGDGSGDGVVGETADAGDDGDETADAGDDGDDGDERVADYDWTTMTETDHRLIRAAYRAMVELIDDRVGRLLAALDGTGQREQTLVVFCSDHGELLGDHGLYLKGPHCYEPAVRVPLIVSRPGAVAAGVEREALVELTDLVPTLLDATGVEGHAGIQGRSFWPLLADADAADEHREHVYCEYDDAGFPYDDHDVPPARARMVRTARYKLIRYHELDTGELYDLSTDPGETTNRWGDPELADEKRRLLALLADRTAGAVDPLPVREVPY